MHNSPFKYRTTFTEVPEDFPNHENIANQLSHISPKPPRGGNWQLANTAVIGRIVLYYWEAPSEDVPQ